jgi:hypothetical protein
MHALIGVRGTYAANALTCGAARINCIVGHVMVYHDGPMGAGRKHHTMVTMAIH